MCLYSLSRFANIRIGNLKYYAKKKIITEINRLNIFALPLVYYKKIKFSGRNIYIFLESVFMAIIFRRSPTINELAIKNCSHSTRNAS